MTSEQNQPENPLPGGDSDVQQKADPIVDFDEDDEEIPFGVMVVLIVLAVGIAAVYLSIGGGHNHFH